jgi:DNA-binding beta-propeller fold protein YncE
MPRKIRRVSGLIAVALGIASALVLAGARARANAAPAATAVLPTFEKDATWPKPLPNGWFLGQVTGISVDDAGHIWVIHRPGGERQQDPAKEAAREAAEAKRTDTPAPRVVEFDKDGNYIQGWGGPSPDHAWPQEEHGITVDSAGHVWISGHSDSFTPPGPSLVDTEILKFSTDGKFLAMFGKPNSWGGSNDKQSFGNPTNMRLDAKTNELFISDGEANHRVVVVDANTGAYKRHWGAYGGKPEDTMPEPVYDPSAPAAKQFGHRSVHCLTLAGDGLVYVCDRANDRIQVFRKDGTFVKEAFIAKETTSLGSVWSMGFSPDRKFLYVGDGQNHKIWILSGDKLEVLGSFAEKGSPIGEVGLPHSMTVDADGNIYTAYPLTRWKFKGMAPAKANE